MGIAHKYNRYKNLITDFSNWPQFLRFKSGTADSFSFKMRNGFQLEVPRKMLPPFKESFFDQVYLEGFPKEKLPVENPVVIDVGANVGYFGLFVLSRFPKARVFGFEPMPFNFNQLSSYQKSYDEFDWAVTQRAVADNRDGLTLYSSTLDSFSTMAGVFAAEGRGEKIEVETLTLEDVIAENELNQIDLLKLDCEGSEYAIIYGLNDETFGKIQLMSIETHKGDSEKANHKALVDFLKNEGWMLREKSHHGDYGYIWAWR